MTKYKHELAHVGKEWLKGRFVEAVVCGDEVVAVCAEDENMAKRIAALLNADEEKRNSLQGK